MQSQRKKKEVRELVFVIAFLTYALIAMVYMFTTLGPGLFTADIPSVYIIFLVIGLAVLEAMYILLV
jgi:hypothetical protein